MELKINGIKLKTDEFEKRDLKQRIAGKLRIDEDKILNLRILRKSIDARRGVHFLYTAAFEIRDKKLAKKLSGREGVSVYQPVVYEIPVVSAADGEIRRPIVIGAGPAGIFAAYALSKSGLRPIVIERGCDVDRRTEDVGAFWNGRGLKKNSNVCFGEGGAGTFSDGKLNTSVRDDMGRGRFILDTFIKHGAPENIGYDSKPHIGTDILREILRSMRREIEALGGEYRFEAVVSDIRVSTDGRIRGVVLESGEEVDADTVIFCIGHSARDTFKMLRFRGIDMESKAFAVGFRVEHPQRDIDLNQYNGSVDKCLPPAPYKLTYKSDCGRGVYSFCMCPGGYVVNSSTEEDGICINGMSYADRGSKNANSAIIVSVTPKDFAGDDPLSGMRYQEDIERKTYGLCGGKIPQQLLGDFREKRRSSGYGEFSSCVKGECEFSDLTSILTDEMNDAFLEAMDYFGGRISGFDRDDCILSAVESRTSSPVRILRDDTLQSNIGGLYPCGEGAGYAGGIMSAAMDGLRVAEAVTRKYLHAGGAQG